MIAGSLEKSKRNVVSLIGKISTTRFNHSILDADSNKKIAKPDANGNKKPAKQLPIGFGSRLAGW